MNKQQLTLSPSANGSTALGSYPGNHSGYQSIQSTAPHRPGTQMTYQVSEQKSLGKSALSSANRFIKPKSNGVSIQSSYRGTKNTSQAKQHGKKLGWDAYFKSQ